MNTCPIASGLYSLHGKSVIIMMSLPLNVTWSFYQFSMSFVVDVLINNSLVFWWNKRSLFSSHVCLVVFLYSRQTLRGTSYLRLKKFLLWFCCKNVLSPSIQISSFPVPTFYKFGLCIVSKFLNVPFLGFFFLGGGRIDFFHWSNSSALSLRPHISSFTWANLLVMLFSDFLFEFLNFKSSLIFFFQNFYPILF